MSSAVLIVEKTGPIATLTLNRPKAMNALSAELRVALAKTFRELRADGQTQVIIVTGAGKAFCAGMDLKEVSGANAQGSGFESFSAGLDIPEAMAEFEGPIIAAVNGHAVGGGLELLLTCDVIIASSAAQFVDAHVRVGMLPGWGLSQRLPRLIGLARAKEMSFTGNPVSAQRAYEFGLVSQVVAPEELLPTCHALAEQMTKAVPEALKGYKKLIDTGYEMPLTESLRYERREAREFGMRVDASSIAERREGVLARGRAQAGDR